MEYDKDNVDEMTLALLDLGTTGDKRGARAWKTFDGDTMDRLREKGFISDPKRAAKSVVLSEEGQRRSEELFRKYFT